LEKKRRKKSNSHFHLKFSFIYNQNG